MTIERHRQRIARLRRPSANSSSPLGDTIPVLMNAYKCSRAEVEKGLSVWLIARLAVELAGGVPEYPSASGNPEQDLAPGSRPDEMIHAMIAPAPASSQVMASGSAPTPVVRQTYQQALAEWQPPAVPPPPTVLWRPWGAPDSWLDDLRTGRYWESSYPRTWPAPPELLIGAPPAVLDEMARIKKEQAHLPPEHFRPRASTGRMHGEYDPFRSIRNR